jgi:hypothetical protein
MYNVSINFGGVTPDAFPGLGFGVLVKDAATGSPVTGLPQSRFTIYIWDPGTNTYNTLIIKFFQEVVAVEVGLPGVYFMSANWTPAVFANAPNSYAFAVSIAAPPPYLAHHPVPVEGVGIGTFISS